MSFFSNLFSKLSQAIDKLDDPDPPPPPHRVLSSSSTNNPEGSSELICHNPEHLSSWTLHELCQYRDVCYSKPCSWIVPVGGNAFGTCDIRDEGVVNWSSSTSVSVYFHVEAPGNYKLALRVFLDRSRKSVLSVLCGTDEEPRTLSISGTGSFQILEVGSFELHQHVTLTISGKSKTGQYFCDLSHVIVVPDNPEPLEKDNLCFVNSPEDFYFGRRGPSVHLNYEVPQSLSRVSYFYNEVFVPEGNDVVGAYYCGIGFNGGYFGIQVNSSKERRVLFSIWSECQTDDPCQVPECQKVTCLRRGDDVHIGEFGNEGAGGQSYLKYSWKPEMTYKFIMKCVPVEGGKEYTAWFGVTNGGTSWRLIASFKRPGCSGYLEGLYSFSENFEPAQGHIARQAYFGNQWAFSEEGAKWEEITTARFTADETANSKRRMDIAAGVCQGSGVNWERDSSRFFLKNCGFFNEYVEVGQRFCRRGGGAWPLVKFEELP